MGQNQQVRESARMTKEVRHVQVEKKVGVTCQTHLIIVVETQGLLCGPTMALKIRFLVLGHL